MGKERRKEKEEEREENDRRLREFSAALQTAFSLIISYFTSLFEEEKREGGEKAARERRSNVCEAHGHYISFAWKKKKEKGEKKEGMVSCDCYVKLGGGKKGGRERGGERERGDVAWRKFDGADCGTTYLASIKRRKGEKRGRGGEEEDTPGASCAHFFAQSGEILVVKILKKKKKKRGEKGGGGKKGRGAVFRHDCWAARCDFLLSVLPEKGEKKREGRGGKGKKQVQEDPGVGTLPDNRALMFSTSQDRGRKGGGGGRGEGRKWPEGDRRNRAGTKSFVAHLRGEKKRRERVRNKYFETSSRTI